MSDPVFLKVEYPITDADVKEAISLKCANCYGALNMANAMGGADSVPWKLCRLYPLKDLLDDASRRGIDLTSLKAAVDGTPVTESLYYKRAAGVMTEQEFQAAFRVWQNGGKS